MWQELTDLFRSVITKETIQIGDIFVYTGDDKKNPFNNQPLEEVEIIDIKNGYIQYKSLTYKILSTTSNSIMIFRSMYKKKVTNLKDETMYDIELIDSKDGPRFRILAKNGNIIASSEAYANKSSRSRTVNQLIKNHNFKIKDED